ncbi:MAG: hypothetical protein WCK42_02500 [Myxococcaceae bacterium]
MKIKVVSLVVLLSASSLLASSDKSIFQETKAYLLEVKASLDQQLSVYAPTTVAAATLGATSAVSYLLHRFSMRAIKLKKS